MTQYGLRIRTKEFETVSWDEFRSLLAGLSPETPLGRMVAIRSESDDNVIEHFTADQRKIWNAWRNRKAENMTQTEYDQQMIELERMMAALCGGGKN